ncbi:DEAD/DEAH box helicase [Candidatus Poribacteria bacterium]|nr:DEAD/DEAH box helicase [Candidatus Poribacteria bacterium]MYA55472.1 DEAD/DEAH box helicase [Candidatus Poribacteria bacterium]
MIPEQRARRNIDNMLEAAGWHVQNHAEHDTGAAFGVAVREYPLRADQRADYLLFINGVAVGVIEAKPEGTTLSGALQQAERYRASLPDNLRRLPQFPFSYASTGAETYFRDTQDPDSRSRQVFAFHTPNSLLGRGNELTTLRENLRTNLSTLERGNLWDCQFEAITNLEASLKEARPRALIQMATGSGKTYAAVSAVYRLIKFAKVKRVLFLVDRRNLGRQALREFQAYTPPDDNSKFTDLYNVQHLDSNTIDSVSQVCITTLQRLYSMLKGDPDYETEAEEISDFENREGQTPEVIYNPAIPIDTFDVIIVDECHRSIYGRWRQVLEYFDAFIIGLTATPYRQTLGFFDHNLVSEYRHEQAVEDNVNVGYYVYRIQTEITQSGSTLEAGNYVARRDRQSRRLNWDALDADVEYAETQLDRDVVAIDQIRTVIQTFKEKLSTELFPSRGIVPKTLIFAKDDSHAEDIVHIVRDVFAETDEFCQKITYQSDRPEELIAQFRNDSMFRIAVSVDMISTGTDIKPLECLIFMRTVRSSGYFEQMKGRGVRTINSNDLQSVTGDATAKTHFVIVDAVGVCDSVKTDSQSLSGDPPSGEPSEPTGTDRDQLIDEISEDRVIDAGFDNLNSTQVTAVIHAFKQFIDQNVDELSALQILCNRSEAYGLLEVDYLIVLEASLRQYSNGLSCEALWFAYQQRSPNRVRGNVERRTDLISLVRFAMGNTIFLEPFRVTVNRNFEEWLEGGYFTSEQLHWLTLIRDHITTSLDIRMDDFEFTPFAELGNGAKVYQLFGDDLGGILKDLTEKLVS